MQLLSLGSGMCQRPKRPKVHPSWAHPQKGDHIEQDMISKLYSTEETIMLWESDSKVE